MNRMCIKLDNKRQSTGGYSNTSPEAIEKIM